MTTERALLQEARKLIVQVAEETAPWTKTLMSTLWGRDAKEFLDSADAFLAQPETKPVADYVHTVPNHCDRIIWRGQYIHLPIVEPAAQPEPEPVE